MCDVSSQYIIHFWEYSETVHQLFIDFKKAYDSVRKEELYNTWYSQRVWGILETS
jgi:hypothetical protein